MSEYKGIKGFQVTTRTEDPVPFAQAIADNPYAGAWASGGNLNTAKQNTGGAGTQTAGLAFGSFPTSATTESYNGSSWTETGDLNTAGGYFAGSFGTYTAAIGAGRLTSPTGRQGITESFDGTSWTEVADLNTTRTQGAGFGTSTAGYAAGGGTPSVVVNVESWNGSAWTEVGDINTARYEFDGNGISTSGLVYGGQVSGGAVTGKTESWDGSSWTETTDFNTARQSNQGAGTSNSNALNMGGDDTSPPSITTFTESWDGSSWTEVAEMATSRKAASGQGPSNTTAMVSGGNPSLTATEEWTFSGLQPTDPAAGYADAITGDFYYNSSTGQFKTVNDGGAPIGTWASGGNVNTSRRYLAGVGSKTAGLIFGGGEPPTSAKTESYNGTSWSEVNDLNTARIAMGSAGTSTSGLTALGSPTPAATVEDWNGTSWSVNSHNLNQARQFPGGDGPSNDSAIIVGGEPSPSGALTEIYNGSSWTEVADLNDARNQLAAVGTTTAALAVGGSPNNQSAELWNGSAWTEVADLANGGPGSGASGDSALAIAFAGQNPVIATNEAWDGTSWTEVGDLANARNFFGSSNNSGNTSAFAATGENDSTLINNTEEWTAADFEIKTVTTS